MSELLSNQVSRLKNLYRKSIFSIISGMLIIVALKFTFPESTEVSEKYAFVGKSVVIVLFLLSVPFVVSHLRQRIRRLSPTTPLSERLSYYMRYFRIKSIIFMVISALNLLVFFFSGDVMILILVVAVVVFFYFERPNRMKIQEDLRINEGPRQL
ncbi:MAG: hypothetical protein ACLFM7_04570 [Bacteroidales bacterium]